MDQWISLEEALKDVRALAQAAFTAYDSRQGKEAESVMFPKMPANVYHADRDALSCSMLKPLLISPAHFQASLVATGSSSAAKDFGSLVHLLLLEPELINKEVAVYPGIGSARDREYKKFLANNSHRLAVDEPTLASARRLVQKVANTLFRGRPLFRFIEESMTECSVYFTEPVTGLRLRVRFDAYHPDFSFDLKTTRHATPARLRPRRGRVWLRPPGVHVQPGSPRLRRAHGGRALRVHHRGNGHAELRLHPHCRLHVSGERCGKTSGVPGHLQGLHHGRSLAGFELPDDAGDQPLAAVCAWAGMAGWELRRSCPDPLRTADG